MAQQFLRTVLVSLLSLGIAAVSVTHAASPLRRHIRCGRHRLQCCEQFGCSQSKPLMCQGGNPLIYGSYYKVGANKEMDAWWLKFRNDVCRGLPFRAGMTVAEVQRLIDENGKQIDTIRKEQNANDTAGNFSRNKFMMNLYEVYDNHFLYSPFDESELHNGTGRLSLLVNGMQQFYVDMAVENGRVKNIYLVPGNLNMIFPMAVLFDGSGRPVGLALARYESEVGCVHNAPQ